MRASHIKLTLTLPIIAALSACGGGTTSGGGGGGGGGATTSYQTLSSSLEERATRLGFADLEESDIDIAVLNDVPTTGSANYSGELGISFFDPTTTGDNPGSVDELLEGGIIGEMTATANFTATGGTLSGSATNFRDDENRAWSGSLALDGGEIVRQASDANLPGGAVVVAGGIGGTLEDNTGADRVFDGAFFGGFTSSPDAIIGLAFGEDAEDTGVENFVGLMLLE